MPERTTLLKPAYSAVRVYCPGAICGIAYSPLSFTVTLRLSLVPILVIVIIAPGTTAPVSSVTRPTIVARTPCAARIDTKNRTATTPFRIQAILASLIFVDKKLKIALRTWRELENARRIGQL